MSAEHDRLIGNLVMLGVIAELDEANARVRVNADGMLTDWIPWVERRAGLGVRTWCTPELGEQVVIACPYGDPAQAVVLGSIYQNAYPAPASAKSIDRTIYADGTSLEYDRSSSTLIVSVGSGTVIVNCAHATIRASDHVTLDAPSVRATGDVTIGGDLSVEGDASAQGEMKAGGIGLKAHRHTAQGATAPTTPAQP